MASLTCMRGYPGSGKSTIARTLPGVVVGRDYIRYQLFGKYRLDAAGEAAVTLVQQTQVRVLLESGHDVIVDDMNVSSRYLRDWAKLAQSCGLSGMTVESINTPVGQCIEQDATRQDRDKVVGEAVIRRIAKKFPMEKWPTEIWLPNKPTAEIAPYIPDPSKPPAIIVDIDGTLAHMTGRSPYDYSRVSEDAVDPIIRSIVAMWDYCHGNAGRVIIMSGRDSACRPETVQWLDDNKVGHDFLLMRPEDAQDPKGNKLPDWIVKLDLFNKFVRNEYNVQFVLDDRNQVVDMWRKLGLKCLQVAPGDF